MTTKSQIIKSYGAIEIPVKNLDSNNLVGFPVVNLTISDVLKLNYRSILCHKVLKNTDGSALRCRINGKIKTWKTRPTEFQIPVKHGLRDCFYVNQNTIGDWYLE